MSKDIKVAFGTDVDAVGGWLGSYGGEDSPDDISRGIFAGEVGVPRLLELFRRNELKQTGFWPGHSIETLPDEFDACIKYDHSLMHRDFEPYYVRVGDSWAKIDYDASPPTSG